MRPAKKVLGIVVVAVIVGILVLLVLAQVLNPASSEQYPDTTRAETIPATAVKMTPATDDHPPTLHSDLWEAPVPLAGPVNTAGAEDSPFITSDGRSLYFFFTPHVTVPVQQQLFDEVTGIWRSDWDGTAWSEPVRIWLNDPGVLSMDGAEVVQGDTMWFASAREGYVDVNLFTAKQMDGKWTDWEYAGDLLNEVYQCGEMHITSDGLDLYFHSNRSGGKGGLDIWVTHYNGGTWQTPVNLEAVNSEADEGWPFLSSDGSELWFSRTYMGTPGIYRSLKVNGSWGEPELIVSVFAGEPTLDEDGNLYFVHHYFHNGTMIEADIYVAYRK